MLQTSSEFQWKDFQHFLSSHYNIDDQCIDMIFAICFNGTPRNGRKGMLTSERADEQSCSTLPASCKITDLSFVKQRITCLSRWVIIWYARSSKWFVSNGEGRFLFLSSPLWTESGRGEVSGPWKGGRTCILPFLRVFGCAFHLMQAELVSGVSSISIKRRLLFKNTSFVEHVDGERKREREERNESHKDLLILGSFSWRSLTCFELKLSVTRTVFSNARDV